MTRIALADALFEYRRIGWQPALAPVRRRGRRTSVVAMDGRITFPGNPWPEGHAIEELELWATLHAEGVRLQLHLESANYYAEREAPDDESVTDDWVSPIVWGNYHRCSLSSTKWGLGEWSGIALHRALDPMALAGTYEAMTVGAGAEMDADTQPFGIYLLGHDAVCDLLVTLVAAGPGVFDLRWTGRIALAYAGDFEPRYSFSASAVGVSFAGLVPVGLPTGAAVRSALERHTTSPADWVVDASTIDARLLPWRPTWQR